MKTIDTIIDDGKIKFTFTNLEGDIFACFEMNPTDPKLADRCQSVSDFFDANLKYINDGETIGRLSELEDTLEEKFDEILGYDAHKTLFINMPAATIMPDGRLFANRVFDVLSDALLPEIKKRSDAIKKYTSKYDSPESK